MATHDDRAPQADPTNQSDAEMENYRGIATRRSRRSMRNMLHAAILGGVAITTLGSTGCTTTSGLFQSAGSNQIFDDVVTKYRNRTAAEKAWHCRKAGFGGQAENEVFKAGFIDGYVDIAEGGKGCTPKVAPKKYWGWRYQSAGGQNAAGTWFSGYPLGVQAAEEDGLGTFRRLPFCNLPSCGPNGCGTADAVLPSPLGPDGLPLTSADKDMEMMDGDVDVERLDGPAIDPSGNLRPTLQSPLGDRSNPFNIPVRPMRNDRSNSGFEPLMPPAPETPAANPFGDDFSYSDEPGFELEPGSVAIVQQMHDATTGQSNGFAYSENVSSEKLALAPAIKADAKIATKPSVTRPTVAEPAAEKTMTIEDIFGIVDEESGGVEVEFDDLPFSFE